jgi:sulfite exporter TauE/SafE
VMLVAGVYMVLLGVGMTGWVPWLRRLSPRAPRFLVKWLSRSRKRAIADKSEGETHLVTPVTFGLLTGLMPCAPLIAAQIGAMSSGSPVTGMTLMLAFGLGTAPLMLAFGLASSFASGAFRERMQYVAAAAVIIFGLVIFNRGLMAVGSPVTFDSVGQAVVGGTRGGTQAWREVDGVATYDLVIQNTKFVPDVVELPAGRPVRLVVDRREDVGCSAQIAVPQLGILRDLTPFAKTVVDLPPTPAGSYTLTCGMAMMTGRIVFRAPAAGGPP